MILKLISIELAKIFRKWRTYIGFIAIGILVPIIQVALMIEGEKYLDFMTQNLQQSFIFVGNLLNGYLVTYIVMGSLWIHIPFLICLVAGDLLAGEATSGTWRMIITRPVSRTQLIIAKFSAGIIYTAMLVGFLALMSMGLGILIFGTGELIVIKDSIIIFAKDDIIWRFAGAFSMALVAMSVVTSIAFFFSSLVENAIGPIISTMAIIIVFLIISSLNFDFFRSLKPYLFTNYMISWRSFFDSPVDIEEVIKSASVLLGHVVGLFLATLIIFKRKDILS